jgi:hypothetical protein
MTELIAKPVVKNKFWIVEEGGTKVATIQAIEEGGFAYVYKQLREVFPSIKLLSKKYNIEITKAEKKSRDVAEGTTYEIYGYTTPHRPHNILYDVQKHLPIYTKTSKSKSYFCAGYYIIKFNHNWAKAYCPKAITLNRYEYRGPFKSQEEMLQKLKVANGQ